MLTPYMPYLIRRWRESGANGMQLWREIRALRLMHSARTVCRFMARLRRASEAGLVIMEGWQLDPAHVASVTHPQLRACWLLMDEAVLEVRLRADTAFYQGSSDVERLIRHYLARSRWANDRVRWATVHGASMVIQVGPEETVDALVTRCVQRLWPR